MIDFDCHISGCNKTSCYSFIFLAMVLPYLDAGLYLDSVVRMVITIWGFGYPRAFTKLLRMWVENPLCPTCDIAGQQAGV